MTRLARRAALALHAVAVALPAWAPAGTIVHLTGELFASIAGIKITGKFAAEIRSETTKWATVINDTGVKLE